MASYIIEGTERVAKLVEATTRVIVRVDTLSNVVAYVQRLDLKLADGSQVTLTRSI